MRDFKAGALKEARCIILVSVLLGDRIRRQRRSEHVLVKKAWIFAILGGSLALCAVASVVWYRARKVDAARKQADFLLKTQARAEQGDAKAQADLASIYLTGHGLQQDDARALFWCEKSVAQDNAEGEAGLAWMYLHGRGVSKNYSESLRLYRLAARKNSVTAENGLGYMYNVGLGVEKDYSQAFHWYRIAADKGDPRAEYNLGNMYFYGQGVARNVPEGIRWYRKSADQGDMYARSAIGTRLVPWLVFVLLIQIIGGLALTCWPLSMNFWEPNEGFHEFRDWIGTGTGVLCLLSACLNWYGYSHNLIWCWIFGTNGFTLFTRGLDLIVLGLLFYVVLTDKKRAQAAGDADFETAGGA